MKSLLLRCTATLALSLGMFFGTGVASQQFPAFALPETDIERILAPVPVFLVTDREGKPLTATTEDGEQVAGVFLSRSEAQTFITNLGQNNNELAGQLQVLALPLAQVFQQARNQDELKFEFVPIDGQVEAARSVNADFRGTPLFAARAGEGGGYLSINANGQQVIPFFFEKQRLDALVNRYSQQNPDRANSVSVQVVPLEAFLSTLESSNEESLKQIVLILSNESLEYVRSLQEQTQDQ